MQRLRVRSLNVAVNSSWVVPYSPKLLHMFQCHFNVELCLSRVRSIKYLFKYVCKGHYRVSMEIVKEKIKIDEISKYHDARYVSASEACCRQGYEFVRNNPTVVLPEFHLKEQQMMYFQGRDRDNDISKAVKETKLTAWFEANNIVADSNSIKYE